MATAETILNSDTKIQILRTLAMSDRSYSAEDLEKETTKDITSIYKALEDLRREKTLEIVQTDGKKKYYRLTGGTPSGLSMMGETLPGVGQSIQSFFSSETRRYNLGKLPPHALNIIFNFRKNLLNQVEGLEELILFGSAATGNYSLGSDIDLYIVLEKNDKDLENKIYSTAEQYRHEFSLMIKSKEEYQNEFSKPLSKLADSIIKDGYRILYGEGKQLKKYSTKGEN